MGSKENQKNSESLIAKAFVTAILTLLTLAAAWTVDSTVSLKTSNAVMSVNIEKIMDDLKSIRKDSKELGRDRVSRNEVMSYNEKMDVRVRDLERHQ
jgi:hypothetical protein